MDITRLMVWRNALLGEAQRLRTDPRTINDPIALRRLSRVEAEIEMIEDRIRETAGSPE
jgi:hypothetical protein